MGYEDVKWEEGRSYTGYYGDRTSERWFLSDVGVCFANFLERFWPEYGYGNGRSYFYIESDVICHECAVKWLQQEFDTWYQATVDQDPSVNANLFTPADEEFPQIAWTVYHDSGEDELRCSDCSTVIVEQTTCFDYEEFPCWDKFPFSSLPLFESDRGRVATGEELLKEFKRGKAKKVGKQSYEIDREVFTAYANHPEATYQHEVSG